jgi:hypothetical protein
MSNVFKFPGPQDKGKSSVVTGGDQEAPAHKSKWLSRENVQGKIDAHIAARQAYGQALARITAIEDGSLPAAQMADAQLKAFEAYNEMTEAARRLLVVMPTEPKALVDLLFYLEKNFSVLPPEIACGASNGQSLAFDVLRTVRLSLRAISKYGKHGSTS